MRFGYIIAETHDGKTEVVAERSVPLHEQFAIFKQLRIDRALKPTHPKWARVTAFDADSEAAQVQTLTFQPEPEATAPKKTKK